MKRKNSLVFLLLVLALAIWGHNVYRVVLSLRQADDEELHLHSGAAWPQVNTLLAQTNQAQKFVYREEGRDPFAHRLFERKAQVAKSSNEQLPVRSNKQMPPRLRLSGIIHDERGVLAVIESPEGEIHFAKAKDIIAGVEILAIASAHVTCRFAKVRYEIPLE